MPNAELILLHKCGFLHVRVSQSRPCRSASCVIGCVRTTTAYRNRITNRRVPYQQPVNTAAGRSRLFATQLPHLTSKLLVRFTNGFVRRPAGPCQGRPRRSTRRTHTAGEGPRGQPQRSRQGTGRQPRWTRPRRELGRPRTGERRQFGRAGPRPPRAD